MNLKLTDKSRYRLNCAGATLDLSARPAIMGIVNLTPDSFFDGGSYGDAGEATQLDRALESALGMIRAGAEIIDVGGESTRPGAEPVGIEEEMRRTIPFIELLRRHSDVVISIDTWKSGVAEAALRAGANIVNDISGFTFDPAMPEVCARHCAGVVLMHTPAKPDQLRWSYNTGAETEEVMSRVTGFLRRSIDIAREYGIEAIIVDPGLGFGKTVEENYRLLARLDELHDLGWPVLAGVSRKSFLGQAIRKPGEEVPPPSERLDATICANTIALLHGADILRVHDVQAAADARAVVMAMRSASS
ncbi:dihydropteroate synthase [Chlorobaculum limnaeum]|uniref:Dihydropteroate synthase n=1 Tax=Chlorobaculum limnaeum TaxID=274537 RepID=A0A1D8CZA9_CHLLM|nr:dihydropteroate synthase [Chlorobaculum limnaeum]AOS84242.1 dihydropteroate synthase [Chlorobaculum limnaeum]